MLRSVMFVLCFVSLSGCYYLQAAQGQLELTRKREKLVGLQLTNWACRTTKPTALTPISNVTT
jgi:hypothetical protein